MDKITVLIPVYNEKESVLELVKKVEETDLGLEKEIILIDDCSTDGTRELYPKINHKVLYHEKNIIHYYYSDSAFIMLYNIHGFETERYFQSS